MREPKVYTLLDLFESAAEWRTAQLRADNANYVTDAIYKRKMNAGKHFNEVIDALIEAHGDGPPPS